MNPSAADPPRQTDNSSRKQERSSSPAGLKDGASKAPQRSGNSSKLATSKQGGGGGGRNSRGHSPVSAAGRERQAGGAPAGRGAAAVQAAGAESPTLLRSAAADRGGAQTPDAADPSRVVSDQPCASKSPKLRSKNPRGGEVSAATSGSKKSSKSTVGCGPGFWKEGCLQSELIQFHLNKSLGKKGAKMQMKSASPPASEAELSPEPDCPKPAPQPGQRLQDEMERLEDENEDLKVRLDHSISVMPSFKVLWCTCCCGCFINGTSLWSVVTTFHVNCRLKLRKCAQRWMRCGTPSMRKMLASYRTCAESWRGPTRTAGSFSTG